MKYPKIVTFLCSWCGYGGADTAGVSRFQYPPSIRVIRVMCSGRVDSAIILEAFELGADGVLVCGCHPGDCHYSDGNLKAEKRINDLKQILELVGFGSERLRLEWVSASEGAKFASVVKEFTEEITEIGPNPLKK